MNRLIGLTVVACLAGTSVSAFANPYVAAYSQSGDVHSARSSMFAGATYRVGLDRRSGRAEGRASLKLAGMSMAQGSAQVRFGQGLELTGSGTGRPVLLLNGSKVGHLSKRANMSSGGKAAVIAGVVLLAGTVAFGVWALNATYCDRHECE
jgi:hypothetical protein